MNQPTNQPTKKPIKLYKETMTSSSYLDAPKECCRQQYPGFREWSVFCLFCQLCESMPAQTHTHTQTHNELIPVVKEKKKKSTVILNFDKNKQWNPK